MADPESHVSRPLFAAHPESLWADDPLMCFIVPGPLFLTRTYCLTLKFTVCVVRSVVFLCLLNTRLEQVMRLGYLAGGRHQTNACGCFHPLIFSNVFTLYLCKLTISGMWVNFIFLSLKWARIGLVYLYSTTPSEHYLFELDLLISPQKYSQINIPRSKMAVFGICTMLFALSTAIL